MLRFFLQQRLLRVQTAMLVQVQAVHGGGVGPVGTVDVIPLVGQVDGAGNVVPYDVPIHARPYCRVMGGANAVVLDPAVGDIGLMVFAARDISSVVKSGKPSPPASGRTFDYADGLYVFGCLNGNPTQYVEFAADGLHLVSPQAITLQAPNITFAGTVNANGATISTAGEITDAAGKVLGTHEHTGVTSGGSNTGPPV